MTLPDYQPDRVLRENSIVQEKYPMIRFDYMINSIVVNTVKNQDSPQIEFDWISKMNDNLSPCFISNSRYVLDSNISMVNLPILRFD